MAREAEAGMPKEAQVKTYRPKFETGEVLEIPLGESGFGHVQVFRKDEFGTMVVVYCDAREPGLSAEEVLASDLQALEFAYVNSASMRAEGWRRLGVEPLPPHVQPPQAIFHGNRGAGWVVVHEDTGQREYLDGARYTQHDLIQRGYMQKVLWLAEDIAQAIVTGTGPRWPRD